MHLAVEDAEVERQHCEDERNEDHPEPHIRRDSDHSSPFSRAEKRKSETTTAHCDAVVVSPLARPLARYSADRELVGLRLDDRLIRRLRAGWLLPTAKNGARSWAGGQAAIPLDSPPMASSADPPAPVLSAPIPPPTLYSRRFIP